MHRRVLAMVLAGGKGTRLFPLTKDRAKPSVPFGGKYRIVDFVLSNLINSGVYSTYVLTQFKCQSLLQHLRDGWQFGSLLPHQFIVPVPAQMLSPDQTWYRGTADAIFQNIDLIRRAEPDLVLVFSADHVYRMNILEMIEYHNDRGADGTVAAIGMDKRFASEFGAIETSPDGRIVGFYEKRAEAPTMPGDPDRILASMGNYIFATDALLRVLEADAENTESTHEFGRDIIPQMIGGSQLYAYDFQTNRIPGDPADAVPYWRDVGTIDAYYEANMDLRAVLPALNLYNPEWPLRSASHPDPPAKFTFDDEGRRGHAIDSIVSSGCILSGGLVRNSVLGRSVRIHTGAVVEQSIVMDDCDIGRRARVRNAILDKNVRVPEDATIGYDLEKDRREYHVTESGIVVVEGSSSPVEVSTIELRGTSSARRTKSAGA
jgi:glucose-1-phosphate adenylyltransferase